MKLVVVGGDRVSYALCQHLKESERHELTVVEEREQPSRRLADELGIRVIQGDGTQVEVLEAAGLDEADTLVALTGSDEANLLSCQLAKHHFGVRTTVARINNPKNERVFGLFGVDKYFSGIRLLADLIEQEIEYKGMRLAFRVPDSSKAIVEFELAPQAEAVGLRLCDYRFPGAAKVVLLTRPDGRVEMPGGELRMQAGDRILLVADEADFDRIWRAMVCPDAGEAD